MKTLFLEAKYEGKIILSKIKTEKLPSKIGLITTVQFVDYLDKIKDFLKNKEVFVGKGKQKYKGQILGCDVSAAEKIKVDVSEIIPLVPETSGQSPLSSIESGMISEHPEKSKISGNSETVGFRVVKNQPTRGGADKICHPPQKVVFNAFLYVGTGKFHPLIVGVKTGKDVFTLNPITGQFGKVDNKEIENYKKKKKGALVKFLSSENIGVLVSTKKGQYYDVDKIELLEKKYPKKKFYVFMAETIDYKQLENFPFIEAWVNTACPRIEEDIKVINIGEIK